MRSPGRSRPFAISWACLVLVSAFALAQPSDDIRDIRGPKAMPGSWIAPAALAAALLAGVCVYAVRRRRHVGAVLSAENWQQLWIPAGLLHGYCTLEPDTEVIYKVTAPWDREAERGVIWDDPDLALPWPINPEEASLSEKDRLLPRLEDCDWLGK